MKHARDLTQEHDRHGGTQAPEPRPRRTFEYYFTPRDRRGLDFKRPRDSQLPGPRDVTRLEPASRFAAQSYHLQPRRGVLHGPPPVAGLQDQVEAGGEGSKRLAGRAHPRARTIDAIPRAVIEAWSGRL